MKRAGTWLPAHDHCCLPSPRLYPTRVAGLVFNFSSTAIPSIFLTSAEAHIAARDPHRHPRRHRPTSVGLRESAGERLSAS
jgi:hypothetical protein